MMDFTRGRSIIAVVFPHWPIQCFLNENMSLRQGPVVLYRKVGRRQVVVGCNRLAAKNGARVGLPMVQLPKRLLGAAIRHSQAEDDRRLNQLALDLRQFTPVVGLRTDRWDFPEGNTILLDVTGCLSLFGSLENILRMVERFCNESGVRAQVAAGSTPGSAWALARFGKRTNSSDTDGGNTVYWNEDGADLDFEKQFSSLPISAIRTTAENIQNFRTLGLRTLGDLMQLPQGTLPSRFGDSLPKKISEFFGSHQENIQPVSSKPLDLWKHILEHPSKNRQVVEAIIMALLKKVLRPIELRQEGVLSLSVHLFCSEKGEVESLLDADSDLNLESQSLEKQSDGQEDARQESNADFGAKLGEVPLEFSVELVQPTLDAAYLFSLLSVSLERLHLNKPVSRVQVFIGRTVHYKRKQRLLFQQDKDAGKEAVRKLVDRLVCRLGTENVVQAVEKSHAVPERSFAWEKPLARNRRQRYVPVASAERASDLMTAAALELPSRLFEKPIRLKILSTVYQNVRPTGDHRFCVPGSFSIKDQAYQVTFAAGPTQVDSLWWEGKSVGRKYYRVKTREGLRFWIFQSMIDDKWFLHGDFA